MLKVNFVIFAGINKGYVTSKWDIIYAFNHKQ